VSIDVGVIERVITIEASPETVYRLLTDGREYVKWKGERADLEPRPGGMFRVIFANKTDIVAGRFVELVPPRRVVFTWGWEGNEHVPPGSSTVEIELERAGSGTRVRLVHRDLPVPAIAKHAEGWDYFLPRLITAAEGSDARSDSAHHNSAQTK
jgi:uncharacterized protein YndB with AHSA1/START domain